MIFRKRCLVALHECRRVAFCFFYCVFDLKPLWTACLLFFSMHGAVKCWRKLGSFVASLPFWLLRWLPSIQGLLVWVYSFVPTHFVTNISIPVFYCSTILWYCVWFYFFQNNREFLYALDPPRVQFWLPVKLWGWMFRCWVSSPGFWRSIFSWISISPW